MNKPIRVLLVDDHAIVRKGIRSFIDTQSDIQVVGEASDGEQAVNLVLALQPDVTLMDLIMPGKNGIEAIREIKKQLPTAPILVLTSFDEDELVFPAIKAGALGYLLKDSSPAELLQAIRDVFNGRPSLHPTIALKLINELNQPKNLPPTEQPLSQREVGVLRLVAQGYTNQEISQKLFISERTVGTHVSNILNKLHLANRTQAALFAFQKGLNNL